MWNFTDHQIEIVLLRHGETEGNKRHAYIGTTDEPLSEEGISRIKDTSRKLFSICNNARNSQIYVSPMKRCIQTAELLFPGTEASVVEDFRETDFGDFEGKNYLELSGNDAYQKWIDSNGELPFPNGESKAAVTKRVLVAFEHVILESQECSVNPERLILIVHGGTIMTILSAYLGGEYYDYQVKNGEGYVCHAVLAKDQIQLLDAEKIRLSPDI